MIVFFHCLVLPFSSSDMEDRLFTLEDNDSLVHEMTVINQQVSTWFPDQGFSVVVTGKALQVILSSPSLIEMFEKFSFQAKTLICCRVTPQQKSEVRQLLKYSEVGKKIPIFTFYCVQLMDKILIYR